jgi:hypothetical protein
MILIDSDVYAIDIMYPHDPRYASNSGFLVSVADESKATTIFNVLEICGKASFILPGDKLLKLYRSFARDYAVVVLWPKTDAMLAADFLTQRVVARSIAKMMNKMAFLDALILCVAEEHPDVDTFITWNARHFKGKTALLVQTPREYLVVRSPRL